MIGLAAREKDRAAVCVFLWLALCSSDLCLAQCDTAKAKVLSLTTADVAVPGETTFKTVYATVEWEGHEYDAHEGTMVLMKVIVDPATSATVRAKALQRLQRLRNRSITAQLVALYGTLTERDEKRGVVRCLIGSEDPRGFPLFVQVLEHEQDEMVRLSAAVALARWNVRRGVAELIRIQNTCKDAASAQSYVCNGASNSFTRLNTRKGWGFEDQRVRETLLGRTEFNNDQRRELYLNEIKDWWSQNEHRFPNWKLGDPLPEVPANKKKKSTDPEE